MNFVLKLVRFTKIYIAVDSLHLLEREKIFYQSQTIFKWQANSTENTGKKSKEQFLQPQLVFKSHQKMSRHIHSYIFIHILGNIMADLLRFSSKTGIFGQIKYKNKNIYHYKLIMLTFKCLNSGYKTEGTEFKYISHYVHLNKEKQKIISRPCF